MEVGVGQPGLQGQWSDNDHNGCQNIKSCALQKLRKPFLLNLRLLDEDLAILPQLLDHRSRELSIALVKMGPASAGKEPHGLQCTMSASKTAGRGPAVASIWRGAASGRCNAWGVWNMQSHATRNLSFSPWQESGAHLYSPVGCSSAGLIKGLHDQRKCMRMPWHCGCRGLWGGLQAVPALQRSMGWGAQLRIKSLGRSHCLFHIRQCHLSHDTFQSAIPGCDAPGAAAHSRAGGPPFVVLDEHMLRQPDNGYRSMTIVSHVMRLHCQHSEPPRLLHQTHST